MYCLAAVVPSSIRCVYVADGNWGLWTGVRMCLGFACQVFMVREYVQVYSRDGNMSALNTPHSLNTHDCFEHSMLQCMAWITQPYCSRLRHSY